MRKRLILLTMAGAFAATLLVYAFVGCFGYKGSADIESKYKGRYLPQEPAYEESQEPATERVLDAPAKEAPLAAASAEYPPTISPDELSQALDSYRQTLRNPASTSQPVYTQKSASTTINRDIITDRKSETDDLRSGAISANVPKRMIEQEASIVAAAVLCDKIETQFFNLSSCLVEHMEAASPGGENKVWHLDKIGPRMVLTLTPAVEADFKVTQISPQDDNGKPTPEGEVIEGVPVVWTWSVVPQRVSDDKPMKLVLTVTPCYVGADGNTHPYPMAPKTYDIFVDVNESIRRKKIVAWLGGFIGATVIVVLKEKIIELLRRILKVKGAA